MAYLMEKQEFKKRFIDRFKVAGFDEDVAIGEWECYEIDHFDPEIDNDPEGSADECISYWAQDADPSLLLDQS